MPSLPRYRYPDVTAVREAPRREMIDDLEMLVNPALIVEVLSPGTEAYDRGDKFTYYKSIESFAEYLLIAQHRPHVTHYWKQPDGSWSYREVNDIDGVLQLVTLGCRLTLRDIYEGVEFPPVPLPPLELS